MFEPTDMTSGPSTSIVEVDGGPPVRELTRMLLDATADPYEVRTDGEALGVVIQREIAGSPRQRW
jgi:hypothetical protein